MVMHYIAHMKRIADTDDTHDEALLRSVGAQVKARRRERGMTRASLAVATGISARFLASLEGGEANVSIVNLARVARALGASPGALLEMPKARNVALLGLRGAGKSAVGAALAKKLGVALVELDHLVEEHAGLPLREIFAVHGDSYYRRVEAQALESFLSRRAASVLATGGGIVTSPGTYERLRDACFTVWLRARPEDHMSRVERQGDLRPFFSTKGARRPNAMTELRQILTARTPLYSQADLVVDTHGLSVSDVAARVVLAIGAAA